ncbi:MAG: glycine zipper 2TM domain-containing protein [Pseudomonadota bacterium]
MQDYPFVLILIRAVLTLSVGMLTTDFALADHKHHHRHRHHSHHQPVYYEQVRYSNDVYGRVVDARPIYQSVAIEVPQETCRVETVARTEHRRGGDSLGSTVVGGLVGAAIGHEIGNGRDGATAVGGLIGAAIGNDRGKGARVVSYSDREVCDTHYRTEYENRIIGYDVSYRYEGRTYQTRTDRHPGERVSVALHYSNYPN